MNRRARRDGWIVSNREENVIKLKRFPSVIGADGWELIMLKREAETEN